MIPGEIGISYPAFPVPEAHPSRVAAISKLRGLSPAAVPRCRLLELGCAAGGHILPLAAAYPDATFVGVDIDSREIEKARAFAIRLGLDNVTLLGISVEEALTDLGRHEPYDYIVAHGLYSWMPAQAREAMMALCEALLATDGIVYMSYNVLPGILLRDVVRDMLRYHTRRTTDARQALSEARAFLEVLAVSPVAQAGPLAIRREIADFLRANDTRLVFDDLCDNDAFYLGEVVTHAERHGLRFAGDALPSASQRRAFEGKGAEALNLLPAGSLEQEQLLDLLMVRRFRRTLLCRKEVTPQLQLSSDALGSLHAVARFAAPKPEALGSRWSIPASNGLQVVLESALARSALWALGASFPGSIPVAELATRASHVLQERGIVSGKAEEPALKPALLELYEGGVVELFASPLTCSRAYGDAALAFSHARISAELGRTIVNLHHHQVALDAVSQKLLTLLDGSRTPSELASSMSAEGLPQAELARQLEHLAQNALLHS